MSGELFTYNFNPSIVQNHLISATSLHCFTKDCFVSVDDKFVELDRIHSIIGCPNSKSLKVKDTKMSSQPLSDNSFRPRGALARTLYKKYQNDCRLKDVNKTEWYQCNVSSMSLKSSNRFVQLSPDAETREFISNSIEKSSWVWTQIWHCLAKSFLSFFMTRTDINGWLGRGSMFVLSSDQITKLLDYSEFHRHERNDETCTLIDVGAGDGEVTIPWKDHFTDLFATEMSRTMRNVLEAKGFRVLEIDNWWMNYKFDVVCMLNLLDRCSEPITMMKNAREAVKDNGLIIIALVLPFKAYVEYEVHHEPAEHLPISGKTFEDQAETFIDFAESHVGLNLVTWSKVPYLCEGDIDQSYYWLDDAVFIFKKNNEMKISNK